MFTNDHATRAEICSPRSVDATTGPPARSGSGQVSVSIRNLYKEFRRRNGEQVLAIDNVSVDIMAGELLILLGPSGCGKTTLLRCIAGLEQPDSGRIEINGVCVFDSQSGIAVPTEHRDISMMFQSYALWPHMTAYENVEYAVRSRGRSREVAAERVTAVLEQIRIPELRDQYPGQMSGGQQQRVALARSLAVDPQVILFDEPLSNVDAKLRDQLRLELALMQRRLQFSGVYVTHDQIEALQLADRVAVMGGGRIRQIGPPREVYGTPDSKYVATFVGQANELPGTVVSVESAVMGYEVAVETSLGIVHGISASKLQAGDAVAVIIRPENIKITSDVQGKSENQWLACLEATIFSGTYSEYRLAVGETDLYAWSAETDMVSEEGKVSILIAPRHVLIFPEEP